MGGDVVGVDEPDPDALWKPGYSGPPPLVESESDRRSPSGPAAAPGSVDGDLEPHPWSRAGQPQPRWAEASAARADQPAVQPAPADLALGAPGSSATRELVLGAVVVLAMLLVSAIVVRSLVVSDSPSEQTPEQSIPLRVDRLWSSDLDGDVAGTAAGARTLLVDVGSRVIAFDQLTGDELWAADVADEPIERSLHVIGGMALVLDRPGGNSTELLALDARTGIERWRRADPSDGLAIIDRWVLQFETVQDSRSFRTLDPRSGEPTGPTIAVGPTITPPPRAASWTDGQVTLYDLDTAERLGTSVDGLDLQAVDIVGDALVGFDIEGDLVLFDRRGTRTDERRVIGDALGDILGRVELFGAVPGGDLAILSSSTSVGFTVTDGQIETVWEIEGRVATPVVTEIGPVSVARMIDDETGEVNLALVDAATGETIVVTDVGATLEIDPMLLHNGYVVSPEVGSADRQVSAFGYGGEQVWSLTIPQFALYDVLDRSVLVVERGPDGSTLAMYG